ncbi:MAG: nucleotide-binding protein [Burkholderiales bacterium]|jgi:hypothetical protein|nr:nucleotide-binding protein [Burkholderiales bacterium]
MKPSLFIASSSESVEVAYALQENLEPYAEVTVWSQGVFEPSKFALESLINVLETAEFGVFIFSPDDVVRIRGEQKQAVRDNIIFELGLFVGRLSRERNFIILPRGGEDTFHLPTDLIGVTAALYESNRQDGNLRAALGPAASKISKAIAKLGNIMRTTSDPTRAPAPEPPAYSDADKLAMLQSWMGSRPADLNSQVIHFARVDTELGLPSGTTRQFIKQVATRWGYTVQHEGDHTILFEEGNESFSVMPRSDFSGY